MQDFETFVERWIAKKNKSKRLAEIYSNSDVEFLKKKASKVRDCANKMIFDVCSKSLGKGHSKRLKAGIFCKDRLCEICNRMRALRLIIRLVQRIRKIVDEGKYKVIFCTITVKNKSDLKGVYKKLWKDWRKFQRWLMGRTTERKTRKEIYLGPVVGGTICLETTINKNDALKYHPHFHAILISTDYIDQKEASKKWQEITGDSFIVGFKEIKGNKGIIEAVVETCKYLTKLSKCEDKYIIELAKNLYRVRCINSFGLLRGFAQDDLPDMGDHEKLCSLCKSELVELALKWYEDKYLML